MNKNKLNATQIIYSAGREYQRLKLIKGMNTLEVNPEIKSDQVKAAINVLVEEINKILENK